MWKLPAHRAELPGKVISFYIVPLDPAYKAGLAGHGPVNYEGFHPRTPHLVDGYVIAGYTFVRHLSIARLDCGAGIISG